MKVKLRQKLAYMTLGGALVLAGHVLPGLVIPSATAQSGLQDAKFNELTANSFVIVDADGKSRIILTANGEQARARIFRADGEEAIGMGVEWGGRIAVDVRGPDGSRAIMSAGPGIPAGVHVYAGAATGDKAAAYLGTDDHGGTVYVTDRYGVAEAMMGVDRNGNGYSTP